MIKQAGVVIVAGLALTGCASNGGSFIDNIRGMIGKSVVFVEPVANKEMAPYRNIVLSGNGNGSGPLLDIMEMRLADTRLHGKPYYNQVQRFTKKAGSERWAQMDVSVNQWEVTDQLVTEQRSRCLNNKVVCKGNQGVQYHVWCNVRTAYVGARLRVSDAASNAMLGNKNASSSQVSKSCNGEDGSLQSAQSLLERAAQDLAPQLLADFVPKTVKRPLDLQEEAGLSGEDGEQFKQAYRLAAEGDLQAAAGLYQALLKRGHDSNGVLLFNAGYCEQAQGNFAAADKLYQLAAQQANPPADLQKYSQETRAWLARGVRSAIR